MNTVAMAAAGACVLVACVAVHPLVAQHEPDFSGEWLLKTPAEPPPDVARKLLVRHAPSRITIERTFAERTTSETRQIGFSGGTVGRGGDTTMQGVAWFGDRLMFHREVRSRPPGSEEKFFERGEDWWIGDDGLLNVEIKTRQSGAQRTKVALKYTKTEAERRLERR